MAYPPASSSTWSNIYFGTFMSGALGDGWIYIDDNNILCWGHVEGFAATVSIFDYDGGVSPSHTVIGDETNFNGLTGPIHCAYFKNDIYVRITDHNSPYNSRVYRWDDPSWTLLYQADIGNDLYSGWVYDRDYIYGAWDDVTLYRSANGSSWEVVSGLGGIESYIDIDYDTDTGINNPMDVHPDDGHAWFILRDVTNVLYKICKAKGGTITVVGTVPNSRYLRMPGGIYWRRGSFDFSDYIWDFSTDLSSWTAANIDGEPCRIQNYSKFMCMRTYIVSGNNTRQMRYWNASTEEWDYGETITQPFIPHSTICLSDGTLLTMDGGPSESIYKRGTNLDTEFVGEYTSSLSSGQNRVWIYKTTDGGATWESRGVKVSG